MLDRIVEPIVSDAAVSTPLRRVAIVTGANHGIGAATAVALATAGVDVLITYLRATGPATPARRTPTACSGPPAPTPCWPSSSRDRVAPSPWRPTSRMSASPVGSSTRPSGRWGPCRSSSTTPADGSPTRSRRTPSTASPSPHPRLGGDHRPQPRCRRPGRRAPPGRARPPPRRRGGRWGRVVGLTSGGPMGFPQEVSYGAAKAALENYTMAASSELAPYGITANIVHPPVTDTGWITDEVRQRCATRPSSTTWRRRPRSPT